FAEEKLNIEFFLSPGGNATTAALASGEIDVCVTPVTNVIRMRTQDIPARLIAGYNPRSEYVIVVRSDKDVPVAGQNGATWQDVIRSLKGAIIGNSGPGTALDREVQEYYVAAGLSKDDYTAVNAGAGGPATAAIT